jgi:cytochrome c6
MPWFVHSQKEIDMPKAFLRTALVLSAAGLLLAAGLEKAQGLAGQESAQQAGQALFEQHCAVCHPNGGNIINPDKPLDRAALTRNGITDAAAIVAIMRKPAPGMLTFGPDILSEAEAEKIADYILDTF